MFHTWLNKQNNKRLIVFFNGWGCDHNIVQHLQYNDNDVLMYHDYTDLNIVVPTEVNQYEQITLLAWSFGIWVADYCQSYFQNASQRWAINGSPIAVSDQYGIPEQIFKATRDAYNDTTREKFFMRIFGGAKQMQLYGHCLPQRSTQSQIGELQALSTHFTKHGGSTDYWHKAVVATDDKIFPLPNMQLIWDNKVCIIQGAHFPFVGMDTWNDVISLFK